MRTAGLLTLATLIFPIVAYAALVNINTADAALLDTLPGIGPSKAAAIIDYRTQHGPFARIEDIQNVSGIGPTTFANMQSFITVGDQTATSSPATDSASSTPSAPAATGGASSYVPPPPSLAIDVGPDTPAFIDVPLTLRAAVKTKSGSPDPFALILWSFGDGSSGEGNPAEKTYRHTGTYLVTATASDGPTTARDDLIVRVTAAEVRIQGVSGPGITIANDANDRLDLSNWRLSAEFGSFRIPQGTILLPESSVLFPFEITNLPMAQDATLYYPDGTVAARYSPAPVQPSATSSGSSLVQTVESVVNRTIIAPPRETTAIAAPSAIPVEPAALGAALPATSTPLAKSTSGLLHSPWTLGFIGVALLAGGAFIFL